MRLHCEWRYSDLAFGEDHINVLSRDALGEQPRSLSRQRVNNSR